MSSRRKDMWRLLYNLVNRSDADLNEVFAFVDDILCKEPSLIRPYSLRLSNNRFQDTFLIWLMNKFVSYINESLTYDLRQANLKIQKRILSSCLVNRSTLFKKLVLCYSASLESLSIEMLSEAPNSAIQIKSFTSTDQCLKDIDPNFEFQAISITQDKGDALIQSVLDIMEHALGIGYQLYPEVFADSVISVLAVFKVGEMDVKLGSLNYCYQLFKSALELNNALEFYYELVLKAMAVLWEQVPVWIYADCVETEDLESIAKVSVDLLDDYGRYKKAPANGRQLLQLALNMFTNIISISRTQAHNASLCVGMLELQRSLTIFMGRLQNGNSSLVCLTDEQAASLCSIAKEYPFVLRTVAVAMAKSKEAYPKTVLLMRESLAYAIVESMSSLKDFEYLKELLYVLVYMELSHLKRMQLLNIGDTKALVDSVNVYYFDEIITLVPGETRSDKEQVLNDQINNFLNHFDQTENPELQAAYIVIAGVLLHIRLFKQLLRADLLQRLISCVAKPLNLFLDSSHNSNFDREICHVAMQTLSSISCDKFSQPGKYLLRTVGVIICRLFNPPPATNNFAELRTAFLDNIDGFIVNGSATHKQLIMQCFHNLESHAEELPRVLRIACCTADSHNCYVFGVSTFLCKEVDSRFRRPYEIEIACTKCSSLTLDAIATFIEEKEAFIMKCPPADEDTVSQENSRINSELMPVVKQWLPRSFLHDEKFGFVLRHFKLSSLNDISLLSVTQGDIRTFNMPMLQLYMRQISTDVDSFLPIVSKFLLSQTHKSLAGRNISHQLQVLELITFCTGIDGINEQWLYHFFKITFFFLVHPESLVMHEAVLVATEMCYKHNLKPTHLWHSYKRDALSLIIKLTLYVYLQRGVRLTRSLKAFTKMLGFTCVQEFVCKYYRLLTTMILPFCVKEPRCKGLIVGISKVTRKPIPQIFIASFLRIYTHIFLTEEKIANKCIGLILRCTNLSLAKLMSTDIKQTVSEFLIYFNRAPKFVMQAFQCLIHNEKLTSGALSKSVDPGGTNSSTDFSKFIADRFLGVITYFQTCSGDPNFEKPLKEEALYSLGQIIRFVGAKNVTQFRFKIIAMLTFVLTLNDKHLQNICLKIWKIFLKIVDIEELGPSLSRIVACLQPLLKDSPEEVNSIYDYIILKNDNLLGAYITDLYFLENLPSVNSQIKRFVGRQMECLRSERSTTFDKLQFFFNQVTNENVEVRIHGLNHMTNFIAENRAAINLMILEEIRIDPLIQKIVDILVAGSRHEDRNLQLASAKCLGELGAIDPSYMPSNYSCLETNEMSLSIHTDEFAIMALTELCRAYQFQKDSKYVDNFSLAIQETLLMCGVSPKDREKMNVWNAIPERMRQIMEPLLTSCYTGSCRESKCQEHPIFNSIFCRSYEEWAFAWASRLIDFVVKNETKHLLRSFKPSIKRDSNTLALLFPYIVVHALQDCSEAQMQQMFEEFEAVFLCSSRGLNKTPEYETSGFKEFLSTKYTLDRSTEKGTQKNTQNRFVVLGDIKIACAKLCSEQIDFLQRWLREWQRTSTVDGTLGEPSEHYKRVQVFVNKFDKHLIAKANYHSGEFARALMYLESYIEEDAKNRLQDQLSFLIEIHGNLMDADSVEGAVYKKKSNLDLTEEIVVNSIVDRPQETISCYEQLMTRGEQINQDHIRGMINCYLRMEVPETALLIADGLWQKFTDQYTDDYFKECKSELLWRLCRYEELHEILEDPVVRRKTTNWNIQCSEAFLLFRQPNTEQDVALDKFRSRIDAIRSNILSTMRTFSSVMYNSYSNSYDEVIKLHLLREVEKCKGLLNNVAQVLVDSSADSEACLRQVNSFFADWDSRLCILKPIVRVVEPILCFRRNLLIETKQLLLTSSKHSGASDAGCFGKISEMINNEIGKLWIRSAQMNREAGGLQQAHLSIMKAEEYGPKMLFLEKAKLFWDKGDQTNTFKLIEENLERIELKCDGNIRLLESVDRSLYAEAKFLQATYNAESMNICSELNLRYFKEAIAGNKQSEKCYIQFAHYIEKIYESFTSEQKDGDNGLKMLLEIMLNYARSLRYGFENVYQSMPRLLSMWLDFTSRYAAISDGYGSDAASTSKLGSFKELARKMNDLIQNCSNLLPTSLFYTAFSQLLSRICHPSEDVFNVLRTIIIKLVEQYPHQSLWMLLPIFKSSNTNRVKRCRSIFTDARLSSPQFLKLLTDFNMLAERLIELTNKEVPFQRSYELGALVKQLPMLFSDPKFSEILLPFEKYMQISLPIMSASMSQNLNFPGDTQSPARTTSVPTNPFPYKQIYITGIKNEVFVLRSAAKPKKIIIQCNDGRCYEVMVKPKDDLRKDFRLMEFNGLVKRYLHQDSEARHRRLLIRTYAAIPFNEECGLVEWLPQLDSFRNICISIYRARGLGIEDRHLKKLALLKTEPIEKKREVFLGALLARHPPVFHEWFRQRFPTPHSWYEARSSYVKSVAVMSMVGYILGLGDRHGENVLFDESSGEAVHVDFNCLFNQGETFAFPELVPFRLTHNMVFAMGPLGVEGMYRKCCEITLRVLKKETTTLMSVLKPFVYDLRSSNAKKPASAEQTDPKAMNDVQRIEDRLQGYVNRTLGNNIPLSTEGQVNFLITEATDIDNLAAMYIGWGSYI